MKKCPGCKETKPLEEYSKGQSYCKPCHRASVKRARARHPETRKKNRLLHRERELAVNRAYKKSNRETISRINSGRNAARKRATPVWANRFFISEAHDLAKRRTKLLGEPWHVDHIVPLQNPLVCGLHVENNLRVIPSSHNLAKGNRVWPDMP